MKKIVLDLSDADYVKIKKQKVIDGFENESWANWILSKGHPRIGMTESDLAHLTIRTMYRLWYSNIGHNLAYIRRKDIKSLRHLANSECKGSALIVGGGPSVQLHNHLNTLKNSGYKGTIVACDRMLKPLLEYGITPNFVLTVDGSELIIPFYKNKAFREHVKDVKVLLHFTAHRKLVKYLYRLKADIYWYIVHTEMIVKPESDVMQSIYMTMTEHNPDGLQTIVAGGNVGVASWAFCFAVLKANPVILIGFDMGYPEGTNLEKTYYYSNAIRVARAQEPGAMEAAIVANSYYEKEYNPAFKSWAYTDGIFREYKAIFYSYLSNAPSHLNTINATEGGTLNHPRLQPSTLVEALRKYRG